MPLQRETVARVALQLVEEVGLEGLTMRRLATSLEIQNPSLYWHFTNKQELLNCMAELIIADIFAKLPHLEPEQDWADWLAAFARLFRQTMVAHRDGARILAEADISGSRFFDGLELAITVLLNAGFEESVAATAVITIIHFILGDVYEAQAEPSFLPHGKHEKSLDNLHVPFDEERFPRIAALLYTPDALSPSSAEARFEVGLSLILDGLRTRLAKSIPAT
jgi:TetR/AcrR family tetracycline transcriptional repressor